MSALKKLKQKLRTLDEVQILELLDVKGDELVDAFPEKIEARRGYITKELEYITDDDLEARKELNFDDN